MSIIKYTVFLHVSVLILSALNLMAVRGATLHPSNDLDRKPTSEVEKDVLLRLAEDVCLDLLLYQNDNEVSYLNFVSDIIELIGVLSPCIVDYKYSYTVAKNYTYIYIISVLFIYTN